jgi:hypothetical protein
MQLFETCVETLPPKQEFSLSAETEYSAAKIHRIFGFGRIFGTFTYFGPKVNDLLHTHSKIGQIQTKFDNGVRLPGFKHYHMLTNNYQCPKLVLDIWGIRQFVAVF